MHAIQDHLSGLPPTLVLLILGLSVLGEVGLTVGMVLPGTTALLVLGFFVHAEVVTLASAMGTSVAAAVAGTTAGYLSGRRRGQRARDSRMGRWIGAPRWERAEQIFTRFGRRAVFIAQFVAVARTLVPRLAGMNGQPYGRFAAASLPAIALWAPGFVYGGYLAGASYDAISATFGSATTVVLVAGATALLLITVGRWVARHPQPVHAAAEAALRTLPVRVVTARRDRWANWLRDRADAQGALAVNLVVVTVVAIGLAVLTEAAADWIAGQAGLRGIDMAVAAWLTAHRDYHLVGPSLALVSVLRTSLVLIIAAVLSLVAVRRGVPDGVAGTQRVLITVGGFVSLSILAAVTDQLTTIRESPGMWEGRALFATQTTVVTCAVALTAWRWSRSGSWASRTGLWTVALLLVTALAGARLYTGFSLLSETLTALLLGGGWALLIANAAPPTLENDDESSLATAPEPAGRPSG